VLHSSGAAIQRQEAGAVSLFRRRLRDQLLRQIV